MTPILVGVAILLLLIYLFVKAFGVIPSWRTIRLFNKLPGPQRPFFFGNAFLVMKMEMEELLPFIKETLTSHGENGQWLTASYFMGQPTLFLADAECLEPILTSSRNIDKGPEYELLREWLEDGLLMSTGDKWRRRRKILTPSFHFKILEDSQECMNRNWKNVVNKFLEANGAPVEPLRIMGRGALDIICETAMGTILGKDDGGEEYVQTVKRSTENSIIRALNLFMRNNFVFNLTNFGKEFMRDMEILHHFTEKVISERRTAYQQEKDEAASEISDSDGKKRQVFLDSLIELSKKENLSDKDIREEVDTFMFAGHDTTSTALQYILLHLGHHQEVQEKAYQEQVDIFGYSDRDATKEDLAKMHYLDQVIKESLRLNPPAPQIARQLTEDVTLPDGKLIPAGTKVLMNFFWLHRNPKYWEDPEAFNPDRFSMEKSKNRHPYSFLPFSAGPRNCIGQKFAMLEMKIGLSTILRSCKINSVTQLEDLKYKMMIVLKTNIPIRVEVTPRN